MPQTFEERSSDDDDHWEIYVTYVDEKPAVVMVDIGVSDNAPLAEMQTLVWLWVFIKSPVEEGFPSDDEDFQLNEVEDAVTDAVSGTRSRYVGRITTDGRREFYFYTDDAEKLRELAVSAMQSVPDYTYEIDETADEDWRHYFDVLYPSPDDFQQIHNQHVITQLQLAGDSLTPPRPVDHFANFKSEQARELFISQVESLGFEAVSRPDRNDETEFPFAVGLIRTHAIDPQTIDDVTFELFELARQNEGEYDGWASKVVKDNEKTG